MLSCATSLLYNPWLGSYGCVSLRSTETGCGRQTCVSQAPRAHSTQTLSGDRHWSHDYGSQAACGIIDLCRTSPPSSGSTSTTPSALWAVAGVTAPKHQTSTGCGSHTRRTSFLPPALAIPPATVACAAPDDAIRSRQTRLPGRHGNSRCRMAADLAIFLHQRNVDRSWPQRSVGGHVGICGDTIAKTPVRERL